MKNVLKIVMKLMIAFVFGIVCMWFVFSFKWSMDDMSVLEKIVGIAYLCAMVPLYFGTIRLLRLD